MTMKKPAVFQKTPSSSTHAAARGSLQRAARQAAALLCCLGPVWALQAAELPALIREALNTDPAVLEARANEEIAGSQAEATRAQRWPVVSLEAGSNLINRDKNATPFRGVAGRYNLYSAGAIGAAIERDDLKKTYRTHKTQETREEIAFAMSSEFLQALRAKDLLATEARNLARHNKIIGDLEVVVKNDVGRRYELVQAQSRALQVQMRIVQLQKTMKLALTQLSRYTTQPATLNNPIPEAWRAQLAGSDDPLHPSLAAARVESDVLRADQSSLSRSRFPRIDLEAGVGNNHYARVVANWAFFDRSADYTVESAAKQIGAAQQRVDQINRELQQRASTAEADMAQSQLQIRAAQQQISASEKVAELYELQFKVGRRSLLDLVNAYAELASVESSEVAARNDYRGAVVSYLYAKARLADWMWAQPVSESESGEGEPTRDAASDTVSAAKPAP